MARAALFFNPLIFMTDVSTVPADPATSYPAHGVPPTRDGRRRVLLVAHSPWLGGAELCLDTTLRYLDRERFQVTVLFPCEGPMSASARALGYDVVLSPLCYWLNFFHNWWFWKNLAARLLPNVLRIARIIREKQIELVYTNTASIFEPALAARLAGVAHVWHVHEVLRDDNSMDQLLPLTTQKKLMHRLSDKIIFESHASQRAFGDHGARDCFEVVYNSVRFFDNEPGGAPDERRRFGLDTEDRVVAFLGRFCDRKNPLLLVRAIAQVRGVENLRCLFVGEGPLRAPLGALIAELGLEHVCRTVEFQSDVRALLKSIDLLVLPSRQESFGLVLVEAGIYGKPVVACRCEGPDEIIVDGETGFLVPQDDPSQLAATIERVFSPQTDRARLGAAAAERARLRFSPIANTRRLESILLDVLAGKASAASQPAARVGSSIR